ncbi:hypothetical protein ACGC1H_001093 [Rhizoctonia solani]
MLYSLTQTTSPAIRQWEEARAALDVAMTKYLDLSCSLEASSLREGASTTGLSNIGSALETFHVKLEQHITRARSTLADTQNKINSPIYRVPREILFEIFAHVVYTPDIPLGHYHYPMTNTLIDNYHAVYRLLGVCSVWRTIILTRGSFWSMVPVMDPAIALYPGSLKRHPCSTSLSLERAGGGDLHLAVALLDPATNNTNDLTQFAPRFRTINVMCKSHSVIHRILDYFRDYDSSSRLTDLSVCLKSQGFNEVPQENDYVFPSGSPKQLLFERLVKSLSVLRVRGAMFHLDTALSYSQLTEIHLQELTLGQDSKFVKILVALSSMPCLHHLKLISIKTFPENELVPITFINSSVSLPGLQTLFIQDLYANTLHLLLSFISSHTHHTTLYLTEKCLQVQHPEEPQAGVIDIQELVEIRALSYVNVLIVRCNLKYPMSTDSFRRVIASMTNLETLQITGGHFDAEYCEAITRPQNLGSRLFPQLKHMHIYSATIDKIDSFKAMMASYFESLEWIIFGGGMEKDTYGELEWESFEEEDEAIVWLAHNVQKFELVNWGFEPPESLDRPEWQLW